MMKTFQGNAEEQERPEGGHVDVQISPNNLILFL